MRYLLDTNICIYMIKNKPPEVRKRFEALSPGAVALSSVTVAELQYGVEKSAARERNALALEGFLLPFDIIPFDLSSALIYGRIRTELERSGQPIGGMDLLIAAQAIAHDYQLVTNNLKEFSRIPSLVCETWIG